MTAPPCPVCFRAVRIVFLEAPSLCTFLQQLIPNKAFGDPSMDCLHCTPPFNPRSPSSLLTCIISIVYVTPLSYGGFKFKLLKLGKTYIKIALCETIFTLPRLGVQCFYFLQMLFKVIIHLYIFKCKK